jgi:hypothetical protein
MKTNHSPCQNTLLKCFVFEKRIKRANLNQKMALFLQAYNCTY